MNSALRRSSKTLGRHHHLCESIHTVVTSKRLGDSQCGGDERQKKNINTGQDITLTVPICGHQSSALPSQPSQRPHKSLHPNSYRRLFPKLIARNTSTMKSFFVLIFAIAAMAAAHGHIVVEPGLNGRRQLRHRAPALVARQEGDGAGPYVGPEDPPVRRQADGAGPYEGSDLTTPALKDRQDEPSPTVAARQADITGTEG